MKTTIVSAEAKARLQEAVNNYAQPASQKYRELEEVKGCIIELRSKKASYKTIQALLRDTAGIDVSHQTVARYCREMLEAKPKKPARATTRPPVPKPETALGAVGRETGGQPSFAQGEFQPATPASQTLHSARPRGTRTADSPSV